MRVIGAGRHMKALAGWGLIMMGSGSTKATGRENAAGWTTITAGTATTTATSAITTAIATIIMTAIETETASTTATITIANGQSLPKRALHNISCVSAHHPRFTTP